MRAQYLGQEDPLEEEKTIHFSSLAWKTIWTGELGQLQSMRSQRAGHNLATEHVLLTKHFANLRSEWDVSFGGFHPHWSVEHSRQPGLAELYWHVGCQKLMLVFPSFMVLRYLQAEQGNMIWSFPHPCRHHFLQESGGLSFLSVHECGLVAAAAAKSLQSCPTLCKPRDDSPPGSPVPGILQARTLECIAISFSNAWKWKEKVELFSHLQLLATPWTAAHQAPPSMGFSRQEYWSGVPLFLQWSG